ncbi:TPA: hypothetical protein DDW69_02485 [candidate division CPR2 bacterium]|uniref:Uncharacterized protein n=1 Tax=candidate division CPR2 bacterium GW2011_GWC1_41_48 TaxID=1618344 RepID=A0A0G0WA56_UNCC2|nr:MAG: hypothetical protein UT47_C0001G0299 [candidate division CPR2 bacterium GW2011_GWC2_39_35]KKR28851.1 MAG: hypothetical protein UT60_C0011G0017 [candidate division CPR2 bacterium GW2011_GWD2_39_7]KKS09894.1 MAG: hypothetical protein UU65_C0001G0299 [candidate division CPR2 bacterium GW2011_GWC1_41_48]OGB73194.1 MAG: hypothetical protein A2Y26_01220 [candidate division CPR2 bacterium GWD2_39_7]HBG81688.1 hypothetical protein [candidate division CPR2 bacterium]
MKKLSDTVGNNDLGVVIETLFKSLLKAIEELNDPMYKGGYVGVFTEESARIKLPLYSGLIGEVTLVAAERYYEAVRDVAFLLTHHPDAYRIINSPALDSVTTAIRVVRAGVYIFSFAGLPGEIGSKALENGAKELGL